VLQGFWVLSVIVLFTNEQVSVTRSVSILRWKGMRHLLRLVTQTVKFSLYLLGAISKHVTISIPSFFSWERSHSNINFSDIHALSLHEIQFKEFLFYLEILSLQIRSSVKFPPISQNHGAPRLFPVLHFPFFWQVLTLILLYQLYCWWEGKKASYALPLFLTGNYVLVQII